MLNVWAADGTHKDVFRMSEKRIPHKSPFLDFTIGCRQQLKVANDFIEVYGPILDAMVSLDLEPTRCVKVDDVEHETFQFG